MTDGFCVEMQCVIPGVHRIGQNGREHFAELLLAAAALVADAAAQLFHNVLRRIHTGVGQNEHFLSVS